MFAALTGAERRAGQVYQGIRDRYRALAAQASGASPTKVLVGTMYSGHWSMPTGASYSGRLVADAGSTYPGSPTTAPRAAAEFRIGLHPRGRRTAVAGHRRLGNRR